MNSIVKKLIRTSIVLRNSITSSSHYCTASSYANFSKENLANYKLAHSDEKDAAQVMPTYSKSYLQSYFKNIEQNYTKIDLNEAVERFNKLYKTVKANTDLQDVKLTNYKGFEELCKIILQNARYLEMHEVVNLISTLKAFNVPHSSMLLQTLFQLVLANLNMLNIRQIIRLHKIFSIYNDDSTLMQSLILGLKHIFQEQAMLELNSRNKQLVPALAFSCIIDNKIVKNRIIEKLYENPTIINMDNVGIVFMSLSKEYGKNFRQLLNILRHFIRMNIHNMNQENIERTLFYISKQPSGIFDDEINTLINHLVDGKSTLQGKLYVLRHLNMLRFCSTILLDSITCEILDNSNTLNDKDIDNIIALIQSFAIGNYKPHGWKTIAQDLENYINITPNWSIHRLLKSTFQLLSLDYYSPELLEKIFHMCNKSLDVLPVNEFMKEAFKLDWCVKLLYPEYEGEMLKEELLKQTENYQANATIMKRPFKYLEESIVKAVNGDAYVMSRLKSKVVRTVDFVVAMRPDGSFVDLSNRNIKFVEELESIPDCNKILIYAFPATAYCSNTRKLFSTVNMQLKAIAALPGFHTIVIDAFTWMSLTTDFKVQHVQEAINSKCPNV